MNTSTWTRTGPLSFCLLAFAHAASAAGAPTPEQLAFFEQRIRPVLVEQCYACHSAEAKAKNKLKGSLFVDTRDGLLKGGDTGPAIVPGDSKKSLLMHAIRWEDADIEMPPKKKLSDAVIADFAKWIDQGAADPRSADQPVTADRVIDVAKGKEHWSFRPIAKQEPPAVKDAAWAKTDVDRFVLAKLEAATLSPSAPLSKEKLARRAFYDLIGLPPTPEQLDAFLNDASPTAYDTLINRLLASPRYGERWGRHWLDVVRYAESGGYEFDNFRAGAYHYRDWVIRALNADLPYDEFIRQQLAGDKFAPGTYDGAAATGFLVAGPYPGQITAKTRERIRYDQLDDMLATIGEGLLGVTLGCVRCHDHKYDPFPQSDYYNLAAALARTEHGELKIDKSHEETQKKLATWEAGMKPLRDALTAYEANELPARLEAWRKDKLPTLAKQPVAAWQSLDVVEASAKTAQLAVEPGGVVRYVAKKAADDTYTIKAVTFQTGLSEFRIDALTSDDAPAKGPGLSDNGNFVLADVKVIAKPLDPKLKAKPVTLKLSPVKATFEQSGYALAMTTDNSPQSGWAVAPQMGKPHAATWAIEGPTVGFPGGTEFEFQLKFTGHFGLARTLLSFANGEPLTGLKESVEPQNARELRAYYDSAPTPPPAGADSLAYAKPHLVKFFAPYDDRAGKLLAAVHAHEKTRPKPDLIPVYTTKAGGEDVYLLKRGEVDNKAGKATPGFLQIAMNAPAEKWVGTGAAVRSKSAAPPAVDPRIALAAWITDHDAGAGDLLARVIVNRVWKHHFGQGLVRTPNDFGAQGQRATHPELLDYLAGELIKNNWRLKPLHRLIMTSAVYQQGGGTAGLSLDPENKLWWHRPARRLEAEAVRDALLATAGTLDDKMFGPSEAAVESPRRSAYLRVKRSELVPFMTLFDGPEPTQSVGDRGVTTVPTQALTLLNSPFVRSAAAKLAKRALTNAATAEVALDNAFTLALSRKPTPAERAKFTAYHQAQLALLTTKDKKAAASANEKAFAQTCLVLLCTNEFLYVD